MVKYILLEDEKTGEKLSAGLLATRFLYANNPENHKDGEIPALVRSVPAHLSLAGKEHFLRERMKAFHAEGNAQGVNAGMDAMIYFVARQHFQDALDRGESQIPTPSYMGFRTVAFQLDKEETTRLAQVDRLKKHNEVEAKHNDAQAVEAKRRDERTPEQAALEELVQPEDRARVQKVLDSFEGKGLTDNAIRNRLQNMQEGMGLMGQSWDKATALEVFNRAQAIEDGAKPGRPLGALALDSETGGGSKRAGGGGIIASAQAAEPAAKVEPAPNKVPHATLAIDYVLKGQSADVRKEIVRIMGEAEGRTTPEKMVSLSATLHALKEAADPKNAEALKNTVFAIGVLNLKNQMDLTGTTKWENTTSEAYFKRALANAEALDNKQEKRGRFTDEERKAIVEKSAGRYAEIDPELQMKLEARNLSTGQRVGVDLSSVDGFDGLLGPKTEASIKSLLGRDIAIPLDAQTIAELNTKLATAAPAQVAETKAAPTVNEEKMAVTTEAEIMPTTDLRQRFAKEIKAAEGTSATPTNFYTDEEVQARIQAKLGRRIDPQAIADDITGLISGGVNTGIKEAAVMKLKEGGIELSQTDIDAITVNKGIVYSPLFKQIETALGLTVIDGKMDAQLAAILSIPELQKIVGEAVKSDSLGQLASIAPNDKVTGEKQKG